MRVLASAASSNAPAASETVVVSLVQVVPPLVEYHREPRAVSTKSTAIPVAVLSASVTLGLPPDRLSSPDTSVPTEPEGAAPFCAPLGRASAVTVNTGASLTAVMLTAVVGVLLSSAPSLIFQAIIRLVSAPKLVGLWLVDEKITLSSTCW